ncbi:MAG: toxin-antitoxin system YwqK family antitoxin [Cyclobacteriaceae bacterium]
MIFRFPPITQLFMMTALLIMLSCEKKSNPKSDDPDKKDGVIKTYRKDGKLFSEITMKNGKRNGISKNFHPNEKLGMEINYIDDKRDGSFKQFYEDGTLSEESTYKDDHMDGICKKYRKDGTLAWEARFSNDNPCSELTEYYLNGTKKTEYPSIVIKPIDQLRENGDYDLQISLSDKSTIVTFYEGMLTPEGCFDPTKSFQIYPQKNGVATLHYHLMPGRFEMREIHLVAVVKTKQSNKYLTTRHYNLAINN